MRVGIDPGHGGGDTGAAHGGYIERDLVNLAAEILHCYLVAHDVIPVHTRTAGENPWFITRGARTRSCDAVVSLHVNANDNPAINGLEIYHWPGSVVGKELANLIAVACPSELRPTDRGVCRIYEAVDSSDKGKVWLQRPRSVMRYHRPPAVLVELGYITNAANRAYLANGGLDSSCRAITDALLTNHRNLR